MRAILLHCFGFRKARERKRERKILYTQHSNTCTMYCTPACAAPKKGNIVQASIPEQGVDVNKSFDLWKDKRHLE